MPYGTNAVIVEAWANVNVDEAPHTTAKHNLGFAVHDTEGRRYRYVKFGGAVTQYDAVNLSNDSEPYDGLVVNTNVNEMVGGAYFHATSAALNDYGWIIDEGDNIIVKTSGASAGDRMGASATDGTLTTLVVTGGGVTAAEAERILSAASGIGIVAQTATNTPVTGTSYCRFR